jgi:hypothetical protein
MTVAERKAPKISAMPFTTSASVDFSGGGGFVGWFTIDILILWRLTVLGITSDRRYGTADMRCRLTHYNISRGLSPAINTGNACADHGVCRAISAPATQVGVGLS